MSDPLVTVRGEAQRECPPDLATFGLTAERAGDRADAVRAALATASQQVREVLAGFGDALERTSTTGLHVSPVAGRRPGSRVQGYRGSFSTEVVVQDLEALSAVVFGLAAVADTRLDGPYWSLRPDNPAHREVRLDAVADARRRADDYAAAFGSHVVRLVEVSDLEGRSSGYRSMAQAAFGLARGVEEPPEFAFEPALQSVTGQVTVQFALAEPVAL